MLKVMHEESWFLATMTRQANTGIHVRFVIDNTYSFVPKDDYETRVLVPRTRVISNLGTALPVTGMERRQDTTRMRRRPNQSDEESGASKKPRNGSPRISPDTKSCNSLPLPQAPTTLNQLIDNWFQCDKCSKWKKMSVGAKVPSSRQPWFCSMNFADPSSADFKKIAKYYLNRSL